MVQFIDLPLELLPAILVYLPKPHHLASTSLVNKTFYAFSTPLLYSRASIYAWHKESKYKVIRLFDTLSRCAHLAKHLRRLEVRDFPKALSFPDIDIFDIVVMGLRNCTALRSCTWTRDGSLSSDILDALKASEELQELEINGHSDGNYDPKLLLQFNHLTKISIIMPSVPVIGALEGWLTQTGKTLRSLTLVCKSSPIVTDDVLRSLAYHLPNLDHIHLTGCPKVTHQGVSAVLDSNITGIESLGLEGVSARFDMAAFAENCTTKQMLRRLRSITLTVQQQLLMKDWMANVLNLLSSAPLEVFHVYSTGAFFESPVTDDFWSKLINIHGPRLTRFSVHRMLISLQAISDICEKCTSLEQLFIVVEPGSLNNLAACLSSAKRLQTVHINYPLEASTDTLPILFPSDVLAIVRQCSSTVTQFGCNAKVWQVGRSVTVNNDGSMASHPQLYPYESLDIPEQFLVVRT
ncbi:hypothetical protein BDQ12DRAFT_694220 [Crucibulum laeve]|uniref:Uncharacterized protein n=1 Tax=Crucibulum laeve TaxID=68775 RepID=A0A5C3LFA7_9AGAR|nr:hypothetical protein BDQ12DRAFT_694220 [Crucibulum laeve]